MSPIVSDRIASIGNIFMVMSLIPLAFLIYTLMNLTSLKIPITHPRVVVDFSIFLFFLMAGTYLKYNYRKS